MHGLLHKFHSTYVMNQKSKRGKIDQPFDQFRHKLLKFAEIKSILPHKQKTKDNVRLLLLN